MEGCTVGERRTHYLHMYIWVVVVAEGAVVHIIITTTTIIIIIIIMRIAVFRKRQIRLMKSLAER